jgi:hypothetical protein
MSEAIVAVVILVVGSICGAFLRPNEEQTRPLVPEKLSGEVSAESAHHHSH